MKKTKQDISLRMAAIIVSGILGVFTICGIFWGGEGLKRLMIGLMILGFLVFFIYMNSIKSNP